MPDPEGTWAFTLRYDELLLLEDALTGRRLSARDADRIDVIYERLVALREQIDRQSNDNNRNNG